MAKETDDSFGDVMPAPAVEIPSLISETLTASGEPVAPMQGYVFGVPPTD